jgi:hypothetical protein
MAGAKPVIGFAKEQGEVKVIVKGGGGGDGHAQEQRR